ncbi:site-specific DNA-methyltransferase [Laribacter hongkongensis]|uniref:site-specific DNA-methyltransferase n=1 Tax=Laribacter hongkongensis TaxID=168471 RepID=UPI001EFD1FB0|nr:site-specific DNA-methyltransferase [Laribacter hongkongensis]MCG9062966.1 site-specific DNA-methyltransferase [Laribacter hongkongensis]
MAVTLIHGDAADYRIRADMIMTDPPYDMPGKQLANIINGYEADHLVLITTMRQLLDFMQPGSWHLHFDFVLDGVAPKKSRNVQQPNYIHQTGVYLTRNGAKSRFDRKRRQRHDTFEHNGYWPTIFYAPRNDMQQHGMAKNLDAITDILGSFDVTSVVDPFAGGGSTGMAGFELMLDSVTLIERDTDHFENLKQVCRFMNVYGLEIIE